MKILFSVCVYGKDDFIWWIILLYSKDVRQIVSIPWTKIGSWKTYPMGYKVYITYLWYIYRIRLFFIFPNYIQWWNCCLRKYYKSTRIMKVLIIPYRKLMYKIMSVLVKVPVIYKKKNALVLYAFMNNWSYFLFVIVKGKG